MTLRSTDTILGPSRVSGAILSGVIARLDRPDSTDTQFLDRLVYWCGIAGVDDGLAIAQALHETANFTSARWRNDRNSAGIGIPADSTVQPFPIANADEAARLHVSCLYALVMKQAHPKVPIPVAAQDWWVRVWLAKVKHPNFPPVRTVADLNVRYQANGDSHASWAWDDQYDSGLLSRAAAFLPALPDQATVTLPREEPPMTTTTFPSDWKPYPVAGLSEPIYLPVPLVIDLLPEWQTLQRPGLDRQLPGYVLQHETDNYASGADAAMHSRYLKNGAGGQQASWHFTTDDGVIYQHLPIDEVGWHAADGGGPGNMSGIANELCVNQGINTAKARRNAEALAGGIMARLGMGPDRYKRHWDFNYMLPPTQRHHCPDTVMNDGYWPTMEQNVANVILLYVGNVAHYAKPIVYPWLEAKEAAKGIDRKIGRTPIFYLPQVYTAITETPRKQATGKNEKIIGPPITAGTRFKADYAYRSAGVTYVLTPYGTRVRAADLLPKVQIGPSPRYTISVRRVQGQVKGEVVRHVERKKDAA